MRIEILARPTTPQRPACVSALLCESVLQSYQMLALVSEPGKMNFQILEMFRLSDFRFWKLSLETQHQKNGRSSVQENKTIITTINNKHKW